MQENPNAPTGRQIDSILGRYEYVKNGSNKFYEVMYIGDSLEGQPMFDIHWGRIGAKNPQGMRVSYWKAEEKLQEKRRKGYLLVPGSFKSVAHQRKVGLQAIVDKVRPDGAVLVPKPSVPTPAERVESEPTVRRM